MIHSNYPSARHDHQIRMHHW